MLWSSRWSRRRHQLAGHGFASVAFTKGVLPLRGALPPQMSIRRPGPRFPQAFSLLVVSAQHESCAARMSLHVVFPSLLDFVAAQYSPAVMVLQYLHNFATIDQLDKLYSVAMFAGHGGGSFLITSHPSGTFLGRVAKQVSGWMWFRAIRFQHVPYTFVGLCEFRLAPVDRRRVVKEIYELRHRLRCTDEARFVGCWRVLFALKVC